MEVIIAVVVIAGLIWFGLAVIASRPDENGIGRPGPVLHRKAVREAIA